MFERHHPSTLLSRREWLLRSRFGFGALALAGMLRDAANADTPQIAPKAKRAIYLFMAGSPSQFETWDYKPGLAKRFDQDLPESVRGGQTLTGMTASQARFPIAPPSNSPKVMPSAIADLW
mgnify:CR=1 FL=1